MKKWSESPLVNACPCATCANYIIDDEKHLTCRAYPERIPDVIINGEVDHKKPHPGDHGIQYEEEPIDLEFERFLRKIRNYGKGS